MQIWLWLEQTKHVEQMLVLLLKHGADPSLVKDPVDREKIYQIIKKKNVRYVNALSPEEIRIYEAMERRIINEKTYPKNQELKVESKDEDVNLSNDQLKFQHPTAVYDVLPYALAGPGPEVPCDALPNAPGGPGACPMLPNAPIGPVFSKVADDKEAAQIKPKEFIGFGSLGSPVTFFLSKNASQTINKDLLECKFDNIVGWYVHLKSEKLNLDLCYKGGNAHFKNNQLWIDEKVVIEDDPRLIVINKPAFSLKAI